MNTIFWYGVILVVSFVILFFEDRHMVSIRRKEQERGYSTDDWRKEKP